MRRANGERYPAMGCLFGTWARRTSVVYFLVFEERRNELLVWTTRLSMIYPALDSLRFHAARRRGLEYTMGHGESDAARRWWSWPRKHDRKCLRVSTYITHAPFRSAAGKRQYASPGASGYHGKNANMHAPALGNTMPTHNLNKYKAPALRCIEVSRARPGRVIDTTHKRLHGTSAGHLNPCGTSPCISVAVAHALAQIAQRVCQG